MKFNYLVPKAEMLRECHGDKKHYFVPTGHIQASIGHVAVRFRCKHCQKTATSFLTMDEYETNKRIILNNVWS